jgi:hypothetical protein
MKVIIPESKKNNRRKAGFSLLEVVFATTFLIMVGVAMVSLTVTALKLSDAAEVTTTATTLNEETLSIVALIRRTAGSNFQNLIGSAGAGCDSGNGCYLDCPISPLNYNCQLSTTPVPVTLGRSELRFIRQVKITLRTDTPSGDKYLVRATTIWGSGPSRQAVSALLLD